MSLKIIKLESSAARLILAATAVVCVGAALFFAKWNLAYAISTRLDVTRPESKIVAEWLIAAAPEDPQTHSAAALVLEETFDPNDLARSLIESETAAAVSPNHFQLWLNLGKARDTSGDIDGAESAFRRAMDLAPNYASVQWAFGNSLIRHGKSDEGFALVAKAAAADPQYSPPAVSLALQLLDSDVGQVRRVLGDNTDTNLALANVLVLQKHYDEAFEAWSRLDDEVKRVNGRDTGLRLFSLFAEAKKFRLAGGVSGDILPEGSERPVVGQISNGGFENGVKMRGAGIFEWQIAEGSDPQIGLSEAVKHSGRYALIMTFDTFEAASFRSISQTVPVVPGVSYELELHYRMDVKTAASFRWEIAEPVYAARIAATDPLALAGDWATSKVTFTVPATVDGVIVRFIREGCGGGACPVKGKISFDDLSIRRL